MLKITWGYRPKYYALKEVSITTSLHARRSYVPLRIHDSGDYWHNWATGQTPDDAEVQDGQKSVRRGLHQLLFLTRRGTDTNGLGLSYDARSSL